MNLERLRAAQAQEREADSLRALPDSFYREVAEYIEDLRRERSQAADSAADPFGSEQVRRLTEEIENAEEVAEALYERRVGKLVKRASLAAAGVPTDEEGLTAEEAELFADLVAQIEAHREEVLASFATSGDGPRRSPGPATSAEGPDRDTEATTADADATATDAGTEQAFDAGDAMGGGPAESDTTERTNESDAPPTPPDEPPEDDDADADGSDADDAAADESTGDEGAGASDTERVTLRITRDVGEVFGVDERVYDLASEDVVTLPAANAKPLLDRDAAEEL